MNWQLAARLFFNSFATLVVLFLGGAHAWDRRRRQVATYGVAARNLLFWWPIPSLLVAVYLVADADDAVPTLVVSLLFFASIYLVSVFWITFLRLRKRAHRE